MKINIKNELIKCKCGCNYEFYKFDKYGRQRVYHVGHSFKGKKFNIEHIKKLKLSRLNRIIPFKDSKPEKIIQNELLSNGVVFEKHKTIFGQPDIFILPNICIFIDGCYWHGCKQCFDSTNNIQIKKQLRDKEVNKYLKENNYKVIRFWEHDILNNKKEVVSKILRSTCGVVIKHNASE
jgi:DNA mismatch endonuclease (patch repair protein)